MDCDSLKILRGSLCFSIPIEIDKSKVLDEYYAKNGSIDAKKCDNTTQKRDRCFENKVAFHQKYLEPVFNQSKPVMECANGSIGYNSRFACKCLSLASKFLDDDNSSDEIVQFFLSKENVKYTTAKDEKDTTRINFKIRSLLHIKRVKKEDYYTHLLFEVQLEEEPTVDGIIFIKHLFYKKKLICSFDNEETSVHQWAVNMKKELLRALEIPKEQCQICFSNSITEIIVNKVCDINKLDEKYSNPIYGALSSDDEWRFLDKNQTKIALKNQWGTTNYSKCYFMPNNMLIIYISEKLEGLSEYNIKWFDKYHQKDISANNKYVQHKTAVHCIVGLRGLFLYTFLDYVYKQFILQKSVENTDVFLSKYNLLRKQSIEDIQKEQNKIYLILERATHGLVAFVTLENCMHTAFEIDNFTARLHDRYERSIVLIESMYNKNTNKIITWLTILTVILTILSIAISIYSGQKTMEFLIKIAQNVKQLISSCF